MEALFMFTVYILYSFKHGKTYTGYTSNLLTRFQSHNFQSNKGWAKDYRPWFLIYCELIESKTDALKREKELKSGKGRDWIKRNLNEWIKVFG